MPLPIDSTMFESLGYSDLSTNLIAYNVFYLFQFFIAFVIITCVFISVFTLVKYALKKRSDY